MVGKGVWVGVPTEATQGNHSLHVPAGPWHKDVLWLELDLVAGSCLFCIVERFWLGVFLLLWAYAVNAAGTRIFMD